MLNVALEMLFDKLRLLLVTTFMNTDTGLQGKQGKSWICILSVPCFSTEIQSAKGEVQTTLRES